MKENSMRTFLAINIPDICKNEISSVIDSLQSEFNNDIRWVKPQNLHLTIQFIGNFKIFDTDSYQSTLSMALKGIQTFGITLKGIGVFPSYSRPRIIWIGLIFPDQLKRLDRIVRNTTKKFCYPIEDRPFSPHLTIGRINKSVSSINLRNISNRLKTIQIGDIGNIFVEQLVFYQSTLYREGPIYREIFTISFNQ